ncbi:GPW/gp25 family protein [Psychroserpens sp.]|uniref:GPW/gp25 family protein n=1 Tax=Psychroserpens sp. TaxID=2020870 RepID=UPI002B265AD9|nr:GPW/gp25 family protein [Psychroserpens sp.]
MDNESIHSKSTFLGSGWAFPVSFSVANGQVKVTKSEDNINDSIDIILQTIRGERSLQPDFGSGLQQFFFRKMDETLKGEIRDAVEVSLLNNEPRITVKKIDVQFADLVQGIININIVYVYNKTNTRHNYVFPFHLKEGTNL